MSRAAYISGVKPTELTVGDDLAEVIKQAKLKNPPTHRRKIKKHAWQPDIRVAMRVFIFNTVRNIRMEDNHTAHMDNYGWIVELYMVDTRRIRHIRTLETMHFLINYQQTLR